MVVFSLLLRIQYAVEGGIAYLPGLSKPVIIDTNELPPNEANELERLIEEVDFFNLPANYTRPRDAADYQEYTISVTARGHSHTVRFIDPVENPPLLALVHYLEGVRARELGMEH